MEILEDKNNFLTNRRELNFLLESDKTPSYSESLVILEKEFKINPENSVIKAVKGKFGRSKFFISAFVYNSKEDKEKFEPKPKLKKAA